MTQICGFPVTFYLKLYPIAIHDIINECRYKELRYAIILIEKENLPCMRYKLLFVNPEIPTNKNLSEDDDIKRIATL